jgi:hypothetical protein
VFGWRGAIAWLEGNREQAFSFWQQLPAAHLVAWVRTLYLTGEQEKAAYVASKTL